MKSDLPALMEERNLDALVVFGDALHNPAMVYFTGVVHVTSGMLVLRRGQEPVLYCHAMEREEAAASGLATRNITEYNYPAILKDCGGDHTLAEARLHQRMLTDAGLTAGRVVVYGQRDAGASFGLLSALGELMPGIEFVGEIKDSMLQEARATKDQQEVERLRAILTQTTEVVGQTADFLSRQKAKDGVLVDAEGQPVTVGVVKSKINLWLAERGLDNPHGTIFAPGAEGAVPHNTGRPDSLLRLGEPIVFDIFPVEAGGGYWADFTRTWCLGHASDGALALYEDVHYAYETIMSELKPDTPCAGYQMRVCEIFKERGHPTVAEDPATKDGYVHSLAHGLGLDIHERPTFGRDASGKDILKRGAVVTIEPGLYYPERGLGMRLENAVYMRPDGAPEVLAPYPLDLVIPLK
ncbi:MAG: aminopeptidase P family protein [Anaerolineales bacterium]|nr:aminopeptidase P family protein [Anaerolineales bacterium]MCW5854450.1 aminopeptidase P family protein [Anaerolineales bacterium]